MNREYVFDRDPNLRGEWDYSRNTGIDPEKVTPSSTKYAWWLCKAGHSWRTQVRVRTQLRANGVGSGCAQCHAEKLAESNPLTLSHELAVELDDPSYTASQLSRGSSKKVWWRCKDGHRYESPVSSRYSGGVGCPYCSGRYPIVGQTDLATLRPDLIEQWDDESLDPTKFTVTSTHKVRWKCVNEHQWTTGIHNRTNSRTKGSGCPYCPGSRGKHSKILVGVNDLGTLHPEIARQLHSTVITAQELRSQSNKKLEWRCEKGHIWAAVVSMRVRGTGCPQCATARTSRIEGRLRSLVDSQEHLYGMDLKSNHKLSIPFRRRKSMSVDVYCEWRSLPVVIEYDGSFWHDREVSFSRDLDKTNSLLAHNYLVVRLRENSLPLLEIDHPNLLQLNVAYSSDEDKNLIEALGQMEIWLNSRK